MKTIAVVCVLTLAICGISYAKPSSLEQAQNQQDEGAAEQGFFNLFRKYYKTGKKYYKTGEKYYNKGKKYGLWDAELQQDSDSNDASQQDEEAAAQLVSAALGLFGLGKKFGWWKAEIQQDNGANLQDDDAQAEFFRFIHKIGGHLGLWNVEKQQDDDDDDDGVSELQALEDSIKEAEKMQDDDDENGEAQRFRIPYCRYICKFNRSLCKYCRNKGK